MEQTLTQCRLHDSTRTDASGRFELRYAKSELLDPQSLDLRVLVSHADDTLLLESTSPEIRLPDELFREEPTHSRAMSDFLSLRLEAPLSSLTDDDTEYLVERKGASRLGIETLRAADDLATRHRIGREAAFALLARGVEKGESPGQALDAAVREGLVSKAALLDLDKVREHENAIRRESLLSSSLAGALTRRLEREESRGELLQLLDDHGYTSDAWEAIESSPALGQHAAGLRFTVTAWALTQGNAKLVHALEAQQESGRVRGLRELAAWTERQWREVIANDDVAIPKLFDAETTDRSREAYASHLHRRFERAFPGEALRAHVDRTAPDHPWLRALRAVQRRHPALDLGTPVHDLESSSPRMFEGDEGKRARAALKAFERLRRLTPRVDVGDALLRANLLSARAIATQRSPQAFTSDFERVFGSKLEALETYHRATRLSATAKWIYAIHSEAFDRTRPAVTPRAAFPPAPPTLPSRPVLGIWRRVFGTDDLALCECRDCKSVFGPAAYLFDMLLFLKRFSRPGIRLLETFQERRPEVSELPLTCDNTNIEVPYIDLLNELLEPLVDGSGQPLRHGACGARSTSGTSEERRAEPQYPPSEPVVKIIASAGRPWTLPFHRDLALADAAAEKLRLDGDAIMKERFRWSAGVPTAEEKLLEAAATRALRLGPSWDPGSGELKMITHASKTVNDLRRYWSRKVIDALATPTGPSIGEVLRATGLTFRELRAILEERFVRQAFTTFRTLPSIALVPETCDVEALYFDTSLLPSGGYPFVALLDRIHRFTRLLRKVDWHPDVLDDFIRTLGEDLTPEVVLAIGLAKHLQTRCGWSADEALLIFVPLYDFLRHDPDGHVRPTTYQRLFRPSPQPKLVGSVEEQRRQLWSWLSQTAALSVADIQRLFDEKLVAEPTVPPASARALETAVAGVARFGRLAAGGRTDIGAIIATAELTGRRPYSPLAGDPRTGSERLRDAFLFFMGITGRPQWSLASEDARLVFDSSPATAEALFPAPVPYGALVRSIVSAWRASELEIEGDAAALEDRARSALRSLLGSGSDLVVSELKESRVDRALRQVSMSEVHPAGADLDPFSAAGLPDRLGLLLPAGAVETGEIAPVPPLEAQEVASARAALSGDVAKAVDAALRAMLGPDFNPKAPTFAPAVATCAAAAKEWCLDPISPNGDVLAAVTALLSIVPPSPVAPEVDARAVTAEVNHRVERAAAERTSRARDLALDRWLPGLARAAARRAAEEKVIGLLAASLGVDAALVEVLSRRLLRDPMKPDRALISVFVPRDGNSEREVPRATYRSVRRSGGAVVEVGPTLERDESSLFVDWNLVAPPRDIDAKQFRVRLCAFVPRASFIDAANTPLDLVVATEGAVKLTLRDTPTGLATATLQADALGVWQRLVLTPPAVPAGQDRLVFVEIELTSPQPPANVLDTASSLSLWSRDTSGREQAIRPGTFASAFLLLAKAARLAGSLPFSPDAWLVLASRGFAPYELPIPASAALVPLSEWVDRLDRLTALAEIGRRSAVAGSPRFLAAVLDGTALPRSIARGALAISDQELSQWPLLDATNPTPTADLVVLNTEPRRLAAALAFVEMSRTTGLTVETLAAWESIPPAVLHAEAVGALKSRLPRDRWLEALTQIQNPVREAWRDALVAHIVANGALVRPNRRTRLDRVEDLKDFLLVETLMSSCLASSRVEFSYSAVQRYIRRVREGRFPLVIDPSTHDELEAEWTWRQLYRLWEANRRVFVHPENWLEPDLRVDKTHLFRAFEEELLSDELNHDLAQQAFGNYLAGLNHIARPEIIGVVEVPESSTQPRIPHGFRDEDQSGVHVFARSRSQPQEIYHRRRLPRPDARWMPWEKIDANLSGTHMVPVFAFGKVMLFSFDLDLQSTKPPHGEKECPEGHWTAVNEPAEIASRNWTLRATFSWIERLNGRWIGPRRGNPASVDVTDWVNATRAAMDWNDEEDFPIDKFETAPEKTDHLDFEIEVGSKGTLDQTDDALEKLSSELVVEVSDAHGATVTANPVNLKRAGVSWTNKVHTDPVAFAATDAKAITKVTMWMKNCITWLPLGDQPLAGGWDSFTLKRLVISHPRNNGIKIERYKLKTPEFFDAFKRDESLKAHWPGVFEPWEAKLDPISSVELDAARANYDFECDNAPSTLAIELRNRECVITATPTDRHISFDVDISSCFELRRARRFRYVVPSTRPGYVPAWDTGWQDGKVETRRQGFPRFNVAVLTFHADGSTELNDQAPGQRLQSAHSPLHFQRFEPDPSNGSLRELPLGPGTAVTTYHAFGAVSPPAAYAYEPYSIPKTYDELGMPSYSESGLLRTFFIEKRKGVAVDNAFNPDVDLTELPDCFFDIGKLDFHVVPRDQMFTDPVPFFARLRDLAARPASGALATPRTTVVFGAPPGAGRVFAASLSARSVPQPGGIIPRPGTGTLGGRPIDPRLGVGAALEACIARHTFSPRGLRYFNRWLDRFQGGLVTADPKDAWSHAMLHALLNPINPDAEDLWWFQVLYHPQASSYLRLFHAFKTPAILSLEAQRLVSSSIFGNFLLPELARVDFFKKEYTPTSLVHPDYPYDVVDFSANGTYADYNWELFYHAPLLIAEKLSQASKFEDAEKWFRLLFDPEKGRLASVPTEAFRTLPLHKLEAKRLEELLDLIAKPEVHAELQAQIDRLNRYPFQPHLIARIRLGAYQKALVMRYLDHLFAWGDELFRRAYALDQRSFLYAAGEKYDEVSRLLGPRPEVLPDTRAPVALCFNAIVKSQTDTELWDPLVELEHAIGPGVGTGPLPANGAGVPDLFFCIPHNDVLLEYWDRLADRQAKLGRCLDLDGNRRDLSLYGRRIDPALLVRAVAMGLDVDDVLDTLAAPLSRFRFQVLWQRAREVCAEAKGLAQSLLGAIEKKESEDLAQLRSTHELASLNAVRAVKVKQVDESKASLAALDKSREAAEQRRLYYATRQRQNANERTEGQHLVTANSREDQASADSRAAAGWALVPDLTISAKGGYTFGLKDSGPFFTIEAGVSYSIGGSLASRILTMTSVGHQRSATMARTDAAKAGREAGFLRRWEDWKLQERLAAKDIEQIDKQIVAAQVRQAISSLEVDNQDQQIDQAEVAHDYLRNKFSSVELYRWMEKRLTRLYRQQYRLAFDLAQSAERALAYELGLETPMGFTDAWDAQRLGQTAADELMARLDAIQSRYILESRRDHEKTKDFSLAEHHPLAFLELVQTGSCTFEMREDHFDADEPGDWFRRLKNVAVTVPCVKRPMASVNARLTLLRSEVRIKCHLGQSGATYPRSAANEAHFRDDYGSAEHIVTSTGVRDAGVFENNLGGDKRLPFEGAGAVSTWRLDLQEATNDFDRTTLTDVVLHILYTARDGGELARSAALEARATRKTAQGDWVLLHSSALGEAWFAFIAGEASKLRTLEIEITSAHLPHSFQGAEKLKELRLLLLPHPQDTLVLDPILELQEIRIDPPGGLKLPLKHNEPVTCMRPRAGWLACRVETK